MPDLSVLTMKFDATDALQVLALLKEQNARLNHLEAEAMLRNPNFTPYREPAPAPTPDPVGSPDAEEAQRLENLKQPAYTPKVPREFGVGAVVKLSGAAPALNEEFTVDQVGDGIVHVPLTPTAYAAINNPDHHGWFNVSAVTLVTAAPVE